MIKKWLGGALAAMVLGVASMGAQASMISNAELAAVEAQLELRDQVMQQITRADVQQQLVAMGVSVKDVEQRIAAMTDAEIAQLHSQLQDLPAGAGVIGIALFVFVVFVITDVLGATDIFPFIQPVR
ncbi:hypothetical protein THIAE_09725 [Thiomicrospira aerophila AL3]|uniref:PA2779 family protein n=1 Tax=Thiomicrospira aerophila AL3 TaxID=717772 RepID=W0DTQ9_9GAMM|nr:DUF6627 family protein [Thiomicrospira aerophila]AHF01990.1 hypothetical protein THIAE_09725 [Thiomicrospira aerophila AL3]